MTTIRLKLSGPDRSHDVVIERGILGRLHEEMRKLGDFSRIGMVTDHVVRRHAAEHLQKELRASGMETALFSFPAGEKTKSVDTVLDLCLEGGRVLRRPWHRRRADPARRRPRVCELVPEGRGASA